MSNDKHIEPQADAAAKDSKVILSAVERDVSNSKSKGNGLVTFAFILSLLAIIAVAFTWYQTQVQQVRKEATLFTRIAELEGQLIRAEDRLDRIQADQQLVISKDELANEILKISTSMEQVVTQIHEEQEKLKESQQKLAGSLNQGLNDYTIEEVSQLLRLANNSLLFASDIESAKNALEQADRQLQNLNNPTYAQLRVILNEEITALANVQVADFTKISARLNLLSKNVPSLPLVIETSISATEDVAEQKVEDMTFKGQLREIWKDILSVVKIQKIDQPPKAVLLPQERYFLDQNIQLMISKAELAAMQGRQSVYHQSLIDASGYIQDYFDINNEQVANALTELDSLGQETLAIELPNISESYQRLQTLIGGK